MKAVAPFHDAVAVLRAISRAGFSYQRTKIDPGTGQLLAFGYQFASPHLTFYRIDRAGHVVERPVSST